MWWNAKTGQLRSGWQLLIFGALNLAFLMLYRMVFGRVEVHGHVLRTVIWLPALLGISAWCTRRLGHGAPWSFGFQPRHRWVVDLLAGLAGGTLLMLGVALLEGVTHSIDFTWHYDHWHGMATTLTTVGFLAGAACEEMSFRGYPLQTLARSWNAAAASVLLSVLFALGHLNNHGWSALAIANTIVAGLWLSAAFFRSRGLWLPYGLHVGWNVAQSILGLAVSGDKTPGVALFKTVATGPAWLTGGDYGPEGSLIVTGVLCLGLLAVLRLYPETRIVHEATPRKRVG